MTPSKEKKALPTSASNTTVVPDQPTTYPQWQTALQQVKVLYLKRQYKQCASRCTQLLTGENINVPLLLQTDLALSQTNSVASQILPLHETFLYFYTALCYEALARSTHNLSAAKLNTLHLARESYEAAAASLPRPAHLPATSDDDDEEGGDSSTPPFSDSASTTSSYSDTSSDTPDNDERPTSPHTTSPTPSRSPSSSPSSLRTDKLKPSPLRIRKKAVRFPPIPTPSSPPSRPQLTLFSPQRAQTAYGYTTHLISFATMLQSHMHAVDTLLQNASAAQARGRHSGAYFNGDGDGNGNGNGNAEDEERRVRIERLKGLGWRRERFVPERYEELCARALAES